MAFQSLKEKLERNERTVFLIALVAGFIFDSLTLIRIDRSRNNIILGSYFIIALLGIFYVNFIEGRNFDGWRKKLSPWFLFAMQFAFGGLFSNFVILYSRSAEFLISWPFILFLAAILIGNEIFKKHYDRIVLQVSILFLTIFSFLIFFVPIIVKKMGDGIFLLSGVLSLLFISGVIKLLSRVTPEKIRAERKKLIAAIGILFFLINALYFTNIIPPIPLSLKDAGVYHLVVRGDNGDYLVYKEDTPAENFVSRLLPVTPVVHIALGRSLSFWSSVFAPTELTTTILHEWSRYDEEQETWIPSISVPFGIIGGREEGYRGYSYRRNMTAGLWRVEIKTQSGQVIGSEKFRVEVVPQIPAIRTEVK